MTDKHFFLNKNLFDKNAEAEINQNFRNVLRIYKEHSL